METEIAGADGECQVMLQGRNPSGNEKFITASDKVAGKVTLNVETH